VTPELDLGAIAPMLFVGGGALLLPLVEVLLARWIRNRGTWLGEKVTREMASTAMVLLTAMILVLALIWTVSGFGEPTRVFNPDHPMVAMDGLTHYLNAVVLIAALLTVLGSSNYLGVMRINHGEYYALVLSSTLGMMFLLSATDLIMLFLALEMMSIPVYALAGFRRRDLQSNESALKYFIIGAFASGILLYGCALLYGATGSTSLVEIAKALDPENPVALLGIGMLLVGLGFKISSVPFHQWAPDVYQGAPSTVAGFMATAVKAAAFGALLRVVAVAFAPGADAIYWVLWWLAVLSMTVGNLMAIIQQDTKRMLAYSSIAHAGYILVGFCAGTQAGYAAVVFYLLAYTFMTVGAFAVVTAMASDGRERSAIDDLSGLHQTRPLLAAVMAIAMFGLAGIPATAGFMGKFGLFSAAIERGLAIGDSSLVWLAIIAVLNSAVSLAYYLRIPVVMYMRDPEGDPGRVAAGSLERAVLVACAAATLLLGLAPHDALVTFGDLDLLENARLAATSLLP